MNVVNKQCDSRTSLKVDALVAFGSPFLDKLMIKLDEQQSLILDGSEEIVVANEVKYVRSPKPNEKR